MSTTSPRSSFSYPVLYETTLQFFDRAYIYHVPPNHHPNLWTKYSQRSKPYKPNNHHYRLQNGRRRHWGAQVWGVCSIVNTLSQKRYHYTTVSYIDANGFPCFRDAFSKREQADENLYVRQKEHEKLQELKKKIEDHKAHLDDLDKNVYAF